MDRPQEINHKAMTTMKKPSGPAEEAIGRIQDRITAIDHVCSGHLQERTKICGKPGCRCATDPDARHGPYYVWSRRQDGRLVQTNVPLDQARRFKVAIANWRRVQALLRRWERESARVIRGEKTRTSAKSRS